MASFLAWLYGVASHAYEILGNLYSRVREAALYAYAWAVNEARDALRDAQSYAIRLRDDLRAWFSQLVDNVRNGLRDLVEGVRSYALWLYNAAIAWINDRIAWVRGLISTDVEALRAWAIVFVNGLIAAVREWAQAQLDHILAWVKELQNYLPLLKSLTTLLSATFFARLADLLTRIYGLLHTFASNPLAFIYALIRDTFESFLCFALAYGLGTVNATLPPWPQWRGGEDGIPPIPPPPPYPPSGLVLPLGHPLTIVGYHYGAYHHAVDLGIIGGEPVFAMHDGLITEARWSNVGYGFNVVVSGSAWWSRYAHFSRLNVMVGQDVIAGTIVGAADTTGNSTGNHLHLEIKRGGQWVNPVTVLPIG